MERKESETLMYNLTLTEMQMLRFVQKKVNEFKPHTVF